MSVRVTVAPGPGLVARAGDLLAACADAGPASDALMALVRQVAAEGGDATDLVRRAADLLSAAAADCAVGGLTVDGRAAILVCGAATAEVIGVQERVQLRGPALSQRVTADPARSLSLVLPGGGRPDPRTSLDAGVVGGAAIAAEVSQRRPAVRQPDRSAPFEAVILLPGHAEPGAAASGDARTRPLVEGVRCANNHFNDPAVPYCQICGISMAQLTQAMHVGPRPPLGLLLLDEGTTLRLDADYVVGREPDIDPDVAAGRARPLRISGPVSGVSRRHLAIRLVGWHVEITDLRTTNGTFIHRPGAAAAELLPSETPTVIRPGTRIELGRRWLRYESHRNP